MNSMQNPPSTSTIENNKDDVVYAVVRNIPVRFRSHELRRYFSSFTETNRFRTFHFRHRPEIRSQQPPNIVDSKSAESAKNSEKSVESDQKSSIPTLSSPAEANPIMENSPEEKLPTSVYVYTNLKPWDDDIQVLIEEKIPEDLSSDNEEGHQHNPDENNQKDLDNEKTEPDTPEIIDVEEPPSDDANADPVPAYAGPNLDSDQQQTASAVIDPAQVSSVIEIEPNDDKPNDQGSAESSSGSKQKKPKLPTCCCVVSLTRRNRRAFIREFHRKHWITSGDRELPMRCYVFPLKVDSSNSGELSGLPEMNPPSVMPNGNVGTPTDYFLEKIQNCSMPARVVKKLGLSFDVRSSVAPNAYAKVRMDYSKTDRRSRQRPSASTSTDGTEGPTDLDSIEERILDRINPPDTDDRGADDDKDEGEEWERHEANYDDVTQHERTKPRLFEEEMEVIWEKGGPGLVWYTDEFYWAELAGDDMDEKWADDWDVDMETYYNDEDTKAGDFDARQHKLIQMEEAIASGRMEIPSAFGKKKKSNPGHQERSSDFDKIRRKGRSTSSSPPARGKKDRTEKAFAAFEEHTKGIGRRLMELSGWTEGSGLGTRRDGGVEPVATNVERTGQTPFDRKGFGFKMEETTKFGLPTWKRKTHEVNIRTAYDKPADTDPSPGPHRRSLPTKHKHHDWKKFKRSD